MKIVRKFFRKICRYFSRPFELHVPDDFKLPAEPGTIRDIVDRFEKDTARLSEEGYWNRQQIYVSPRSDSGISAPPSYTKVIPINGYYNPRSNFYIPAEISDEIGKHILNEINRRVWEDLTFTSYDRPTYTRPPGTTD